MNMPYVVGPPVKQPTDFFGRARQTKQFFQLLAGPQVQCVSVLGLRRAGKTSFLQHIAHPEVRAAYLPDHARYLMVYVDISSCRSPADFYSRVYQKLSNALPRARAATNGALPEANVYAVESLLYEFGDRRVVLLLDEFDQLRSESFNSDFLVEMRALTSVWDFELAYVTASYWDLFRLGNFVGLPVTSPFYNIFYPTPIYLSGLSPDELDALVRVPAGRVGFRADEEDVAYLRHHAGTLPFFVQAMAAIWLDNRMQNRTPDTRAVIQQLVSEMGPYFEQWWRNFNDVEREVLAAVIQEKPVHRLPYNEPEIDEAVRRLLNYGVICTTGDHLWTDSQLFSRWLQEHTGRVRGGEPNLAVSRRPGVAVPATSTSGGSVFTPGKKWMDALEAMTEQIRRDLASHQERQDSELRDAILSSLETDRSVRSSEDQIRKAGTGDIVVRVGGANVFAASIQRWQGQQAFLESVSQLLSYLSQRHSAGTLIVIAREKDVAIVGQAINQALPWHPAFVSAMRRTSGNRLDFLFHLNGDPHSEVDLSVLLISCPG